MSTFSGFPPDTTEFLKEIAKNNSKKFFDANRDRYQTALIEPAKLFVTAVGAELQQRVSKAIHADPRVNGSIFRMNRDIRFSKDKTPYKTHLDMFFWEGDGRSRECGGFFFRLTPNDVIVGAGMHGFDKTMLDRFRKAVVDPRRGAALEKAIAASTKRKGVKLGEPRYKKVPRGYDADHARAELLKYDGMFAHLQEKLPKVLGSVRFVDWVADRFESVAPLHKWVLTNVKS